MLLILLVILYIFDFIVFLFLFQNKLLATDSPASALQRGVDIRHGFHQTANAQHKQQHLVFVLNGCRICAGFLFALFDNTRRLA